MFAPTICLLCKTAIRFKMFHVKHSGIIPGKLHILFCKGGLHMKISRELYKTMQDQTAPRSKSWKNIPLAFLIGGLICTIGEAGIHILTEYCGMEQKNASAWVSIGLVAVSAVCTGLGWYAKLGKHAGAGTLVPITGLPTAWFPPPSRHAPRAGSWASAHAFSPSPGRSSSTAPPHPWCTGCSIISGRFSGESD